MALMDKQKTTPVVDLKLIDRIIARHKGQKMALNSLIAGNPE